MVKNLITLGILFLFLGIILILAGSLFTAKGEKSSAKIAFGGFIGLMPFGFASDKQMYYILIALMLFSLIFFYFLSRIQP